MSKKVLITSDPFQPKISRNDRFAQMSHQEKVIEQKKKEIQAKLEAKQKSNAADSNKSNNASSANPTKAQPNKSLPKKIDLQKKSGLNLFSNDGSFLDTFKQLKDKRLDSKLKSFKPNKEHGLNKNNSRWSQSRRRSPSPKDRQKVRTSRFSDKAMSFENNKITINTSFNSTVVTQSNFDNNNQVSISPQNVIGQPLLKNILPPASVTYHPQSSAPVIAAPPLLLNVPPPQIVQSQILLPNSSGNVLVSTPTVNTVNLSASNILTTVTLPPSTIISSQTAVAVNTAQTAAVAVPVPPPCIQPPPVELSSIPPPNPIQLQNIPQPEPLNTMNIPHPAPIQVQNIPTPNSIQLNEIPNPKPLDLLAIPTPNEENKSMSDPSFIKNIPPPNKSIPPPNLANETNLNVPPPNIPPPPPPPPTTITIQNITPCQNILVHTHTIPPPQAQIMQTTSVPPPNLQQPSLNQNFSTISVALPVGTTTNNNNSNIPALMAQPILPPTNVNVNCPPPLLPLPNFVNQPPPPPQMPPMNVPPPTSNNLGIINTSIPPFRDTNAVFPPGTPDYEAMASLGRMVAQCGPGIEDIVRQRKTQDPNLWFLFHKESAAYQQYQQIIEQFKREYAIENKDKYKPEDIYEPEMPIEDDDNYLKNYDINDEKQQQQDNNNKRKRKSRWGDKEPNSLPTSSSSSSSLVLINNNNLMISKITRNDPGLIQYAINTYGSRNLTEENWKKAEDHYKINLLYQDMMRKREELESGQNKYDYDSDEDIEGGTWEHKLRDKEMMATQLWAQELTRQAEGKHHIGDFLPPEELKRFMEKTNANAKEGRMPNFSDYKEFKIKEDNIGFKMLQKLGWSEGQGLGTKNAGIIEPINKAPLHENKQGLGLSEQEKSDEDEDDEYEAYRKRMMLAYRFRPNPLNNPRRPYY